MVDAHLSNTISSMTPVLPACCFYVLAVTPWVVVVILFVTHGRVAGVPAPETRASADGCWWSESSVLLTIGWTIILWTLDDMVDIFCCGVSWWCWRRGESDAPSLFLLPLCARHPWARNRRKATHNTSLHVTDILTDLRNWGRFVKFIRHSSFFRSPFLYSQYTFIKTMGLKVKIKSKSPNAGRLDAGCSNVFSTRN